VFRAEGWGAVGRGNEASMSAVTVQYIWVGGRCRSQAEESTSSAHNNPISKHMTLKICSLIMQQTEEHGHVPMK
jgi:hypothetical protein